MTIEVTMDGKKYAVRVNGIQRGVSYINEAYAANEVKKLTEKYNALLCRK